MLRRGFVATAFCSLFGLAGARWSRKKDDPWHDLKDVIGPEWKKAPDRTGFWFWRKTPDDAPTIVSVYSPALRAMRYDKNSICSVFDEPKNMGGEWAFIKMPDWKEDEE